MPGPLDSRRARPSLRRLHILDVAALLANEVIVRADRSVVPHRTLAYVGHRHLTLLGQAVEVAVNRAEAYARQYPANFQVDGRGRGVIAAPLHGGEHRPQLPARAPAGGFRPNHFSHLTPSAIAMPLGGAASSVARLERTASGNTARAR